MAALTAQQPSHSWTICSANIQTRKCAPTRYGTANPISSLCCVWQTPLASSQGLCPPFSLATAIGLATRKRSVTKSRRQWLRVPALVAAMLEGGPDGTHVSVLRPDESLAKLGPAAAP